MKESKKGELANKLKNNKKIIFIVGGLLLIMVVALLFVLNNNDNKEGNGEVENNQTIDNQNEFTNLDKEIYNSDGSYKIPKDYVSTDEECFEFDHGVITDFYCMKNNKYGYDVVYDLVIPYEIDGEYVTEIGESAFKYDESKGFGFTSVTMPNSITKVGDMAFGFSLKATPITFSKNLQHIGYGAFEDNKDGDKCVDKLEIPKSVESIGTSAFYNSCYKEVTVSSKNIGGWAFSGDSIEILNLGEGIKTIEAYAFSDNFIKEIKLPNSLEKIQVSAFEIRRYTPIKLTTIILNNNPNLIIEDKAFYGHKSIEKVYLNAKEQRRYDWNEFIESSNENIEYILPEEKNE